MPCDSSLQGTFMKDLGRTLLKLTYSKGSYTKVFAHPLFSLFHRRLLYLVILERGIIRLLSYSLPSSVSESEELPWVFCKRHA